MKTVVMTGGTAGLGAVAAQQIFRTQNTRLLLGARGRTPNQIETLHLDLTSLANVRAFAADVAAELRNTLIDVLVLNAGVQFTNVNQRTKDGFETTFAVNHLSHYLLLRLLLPRLAECAVVVITTSDTHDPALNPLGPKQIDPERLAHPPVDGPRGFLAGVRVYSSSKLCNLLSARALAASADAKARDVRVVAYNYRSVTLTYYVYMSLLTNGRKVSRC